MYTWVLILYFLSGHVAVIEGFSAKGCLAAAAVVKAESRNTVTYCVEAL